MRKILFILLFTFIIKPLFAECLEYGMYFYPRTVQISLNSMFIIEGYSFDEDTIDSFRNRNVYLESKSGELIKLNLKEILKGQMELTQAIFVPSRELTPNTIYFLKYQNQTKHEGKSMFRYNAEKDKMEKVYWKTGTKRFADDLEANIDFKFQEMEFEMYGCGSSEYAVYNIENKPDFEVWYKIEVVDIKTNKKTTYYLSGWKGKVNVGHGMCAGAFRFDRGGRYKIRFTPMNIDGYYQKTTIWKYLKPFDT